MHAFVNAHEGPPEELGHAEVDVVGYGRAATAALARRVTAAKAAGHPLDPITVVVPSNTAGLSARRLLAVGDARTGLPSTNLANVSFATPFRLAEMLGSTLIGAGKPLTNPVLASAVRAALADHPGMFAAVAGHQATQSAIVALYSDLSRTLPATRERIAAASRRGAEVIRVVAEIEARLRGFFDEDDLAEAATAHLHAAPEATDQLGTLIWYLPDRLTPAMTSMMATALARTRSASVIVALTAESTADAAVVDAVRRVGIALEEPAASDSGIGKPSANRIISVSDGDEEVRQVVREILELVGEGTPLDRMAVFLPASASYGPTLIQQLEGAGIPHNAAATKRLADTVAGRTLLAALALDNNGWGRSDVIALVADAPVRAGDRLAPSRRWDAISRRAGVVGGLSDWQAKLHQLEATLEATITDLDTDESDKDESARDVARRNAVALDLETTGHLAAFIDSLADGLAALDQSRTWAERAGASKALVDTLLGHEQLRSRWPEFEVAAAQRVDEAITGLATLDGIEANPTRATFELAVSTELDVTVGRIGRFGHGVLVAPLSSAAGLDLDAVFVLGLAEGTCPSIRQDDALLPDVDRHRAAAGELQTQDDLLGAQHRNYLAALAAAGQRRTLLFPRGDLRGRRHRLPSRWMLDSVSELAGRRLFSSDVAALREVIHTVASYAAGVAQADVHGSVVERDVAALLASGNPVRHPLAVGALGRGFAARSARTGPDFTPWDGNLADAAGDIASPATGVAMSPSRLETWASCPFKYFLAHVLGLREREDPERIVEMSPAEKGTLIHAVLEAFITEVLNRREGPPAPEVQWTPDDRRRVGELAEEKFVVVEDKGLTGRPLTWRRTKTEVLIDLDIFLTKDDEHRRMNRVRPVLAEMAFGMDGEAPLSIQLPSGRTLSFRGKADRVDIADDGHLVVLDYKTGSGWGYDKLVDDPVRAGTTLQLGLYAEAALARLGADEADTSYWVISSRGKYKKHGYPWTEATRKRFLDVTEAIVDGIESGLFPALPGEYDSFFGKHDNCTYCDFDRICPRDREDHQRATAGAPELTLLQRLALKEEQA